MAKNDLNIVCSKINDEKEYLNSISQYIWHNPELKFEEHYAHNLLTAALSKFGFDVTNNYLLPTAFKGEFGSKEGKGPTIAVILEYDALPEIGHGCGHNLISEAGLAAAIGIKAAMEEDSSIIGKIIVLGTPAEEGGGGKVKLIKKGAFKDIDVAMMVHPRPYTLLAPTYIGMIPCTIDFKGKESHASAYPWEGINALDAAVAFYQNIGLLRQQIKPTCRLHAIITKGGTAPNVIPAETQVFMFLRAPSIEELHELREKVNNCAKGAAVSTGCSHSIQYDLDNCYEPLISNPILIKIFADYAEKTGLPMTDPSTTGAISTGSTDMGNVSQIIPSIHPVYDILTKAANHTKQFTTASISPNAQGPTLAAAKTMAMTALTLFRNSDIMADAKASFTSSSIKLKNNIK